MILNGNALFITAYDRIEFLEETLASWRNVRGFTEWPVYAMIEPSPKETQAVMLFEELEHPNLHISVNPQRYGVLHHPWVGFTKLFDRYDFVLRAEDDLIVSSDILEYVEWAALEYKRDPEIGTINGFTREEGSEDGVRRVSHFDPWIWGTWRDRWSSFMRDTWDHDYSTYNRAPGIEAGWDWNLDTRIFPELGLKGVFPTASRVQNIGRYGTHAQVSEFPYTLSPSFVAERPKSLYHEV